MSSIPMRAADWSVGCCYLLMFGLLVVSTSRLVVQDQGRDVVSTELLVTPGATLTYSESCPPDSFISSWTFWSISWNSGNGAIPILGQVRLQCSDGSYLPMLGQQPLDNIPPEFNVTDTGVTGVVARSVPLDHDGSGGGTRLLQKMALITQIGPSGKGYDATPSPYEEFGVVLCPSGQILVGLSGSTLASGIAAIGLICGRRPAARSEVQDDWGYIGKESYLGELEPAGFFNQSCPPGFFINEIKTQGRIDGTPIALSRIQAVCSDETTVLGPLSKRVPPIMGSKYFPEGIAGLSATTWWWPFGDIPLITQLSYIMRPPVDATVMATRLHSNHSLSICGISGQVAIGIFGYVGDYVNRLGILCGSVPTLLIAPSDNSTTESPEPATKSVNLTPPTPSPVPPPSPPSSLTKAQKIGAIVAPIATASVGAAFTIAYTSWKWYHKRKAKVQDARGSSGSLPSVAADTQFK